MAARETIEDLIEKLRTPAGGWTKADLEELGVGWPPPRGWKKRLISATRSTVKQFHDNLPPKKMESIHGTSEKDLRDQLASEIDKTRNVAMKMITQIFGGRVVVKADVKCSHCAGCAGFHRTVERVWPDGRRSWGCHFCGRKLTDAKNEAKTDD